MLTPVSGTGQALPDAIVSLGELRLGTGAIEEEGQRAAMRGQVVGQAGAVLFGLDFDAGERGSERLGFDHARGRAVDVKQVGREAVAG